MQRCTLLLLSLLAYNISFCQITQPVQPASGPGGSNYTYGGVTQYDYGTLKNGDGFWLYEPSSPIPDSANVIVFCHGLNETNPMYYGAFITHLVRKGNIVIYPRYQKNEFSGATTFTDSCAKGIQRALDTLQLPGHVKPRLYNYFVLGHSVGGILTANIAAKYSYYNLPKPLTAFSIEPGATFFESQLMLSDYSIFSTDIKYLVAIGNDDAIVGTTVGTQLYNQTTSVPTSHKNLVKLYADNYGTPAITASHTEPIGYDSAYNNGETNTFIQLSAGVIDAVDFYCYWKLQDALMDCALNNQNCDVAFGDTPQQRYMGQWSDGTPVRELEITPSANTGISTVLSSTRISISPNPSNTNWQLCIDNYNSNLNFQCNLYDVAGRLLRSQNITSGTTTIKNTIGSGIYFYQIKNNNEETIATGKLIAQ
jgi:hypothetical protein